MATGEKRMKILVVGGGGREHALCWKLARSPQVEKVYCAPGNAGISKVAECVNLGVDELEKLADFAESNGIGLTVTGPEAPLCAGIVDIFIKRGLVIFGPDKEAAQLEGSKAYAKAFMNKYGIPTAEAKTFDNEADALAYVEEKFNSGVNGLVVKADGLAAGKGVIVAATREEAEAGVKECFSGTFGAAGNTVLIEEMLVGEEASILALTDGKTIVPLASSQDHKRMLDGDQGPNTGGMGAYSPAPVVDNAMQEQVNKEVLGNFLRGVQEENLRFRGIIYAGIMVTAQGPKVLEFNVRFGDPEVQAVLMRLDSDLAEALLQTAKQNLADVKLEWSNDAAVCVVMASGGYPKAYQKGHPIAGLDEAETEGAVVFHAGTKFNEENVVNAGGRVLGVTARGADIREAIANAYKAVEKIRWQDCFFRKDIGHRALNRHQG